jgi:hypothetical protein
MLDRQRASHDRDVRGERERDCCARCGEPHAGRRKPIQGGRNTSADAVGPQRINRDEDDVSPCGRRQRRAAAHEDDGDYAGEQQ